MTCGKIPYRTEEDAWRAAHRGIEAGHYSDMKVYCCRRCYRAWHLTTAKVQLHDWILLPNRRQPRRVRAWFKWREVEEKMINVEIIREAKRQIINRAVKPKGNPPVFFLVVSEKDLRLNLKELGFTPAEIDEILTRSERI